MPSELLRGILLSLAQLIFSSRTLAIMKAQILAKALNPSGTGAAEQKQRSTYSRLEEGGDQVNRVTGTRNFNGEGLTENPESSKATSTCDHHYIFEYESDGFSDCEYGEDDAYAYTGMVAMSANPIRVPCNSPAMTPPPSLEGFESLSVSYSSTYTGSALPYDSGEFPPTSFGEEDDLSDGIHQPSAVPDDSAVEADTSACDVSLVSDTSELEEEEEEDGALVLSATLADDTLTTARSARQAGESSNSDVLSCIYESVAPPRRLARPPTPGAGLGIRGLLRKDGCEPFDGLGVLNLRGTSWRTVSPSRSVSPSLKEDRSYFFGPEDDRFEEYEERGISPELSDTFREEALRTFQDDPCHSYTLCTIPESESSVEQSWRVLGEDAAVDESLESQATYVYPHSSPVVSTRDSSTRAGRLTRHNKSFQNIVPDSRPNVLHSQRPPRDFTAATYSSSMKRAASAAARSTGTDAYYLPLHARRARSATWPMHAEGARASVHMGGLSPSPTHVPGNSRSTTNGLRRGTSQPMWRI